MNTKSLGLVSCTKKKKTYPCKASEMYSVSDLFRKAYAHSVKTYDVVVILSAKYGLLFPHDRIKPYNLTLNNMSSGEVKDWSERVFKQMNDRLQLRIFDKAYFHAGKRYRQYLIPKVESKGIPCEAPLRDLGIGKQLAWYKKHDC